MFLTQADFQRADWPLLQNGAVNLFWNRQVLAGAQQDLDALGYRMHQIDCADSRTGWQQQLSLALSWEQQFGYASWNGGLDALIDGLRDFPFGPSGRTALVFTAFHRLANSSPQTAHSVLDILECAARDHLLCGRLLITLVQTDDNRFSCPPVGARGVNWNPREWLLRDRGL